MPFTSLHALPRLSCPSCLSCLLALLPYCLTALTAFPAEDNKCPRRKAGRKVYPKHENHMTKTDTPHILIINPTRHEYKATCRLLAGKNFDRIKPVVRESGPGKINAAFSLTLALHELKQQGAAPRVVIGAGTSGSLNYDLKNGDIIFSTTSVISDYQMLTEHGLQSSPYGLLNFIEPQNFRPADIAISCTDPLTTDLAAHMTGKHCKLGAMLTSDTFVTGKENRLQLGRHFDCLACDMESGAFAYLAQNKLQTPWFNLRIVADTLNEDFEHYQLMETEMSELLAGRLLVVLQALDEML